MTEQTPVSHVPLGGGSEFELIRRMLDRWGNIAKGIGDDAAVLTVAGGDLVISTDTSIENVHFRRGWLEPNEIGYRAAAAALSDLAAMGARSLGMLVAMGIPEGWRSSIDGLSDGIGESARAFDSPIIGGDISRAAELTLTFTVLGTARNALRRSGAREGDHVFVTGRLGGPARAIQAFSAGQAPTAWDRERFAHPLPRIREAEWLAAHGARAAIDISDGLGADLGHLASASNVMIVVNVDRIPVGEAIDPVDAAASGEEYELVVTSPDVIDAAEFQQVFQTDLTEIGRVERGSAGVRFVLGGREVKVPAGFLHFAD